MTTENNTQPTLVEPLPEISTDASIHLGAAQAIADVATVMTGVGCISDLRSTSLCNLMCLLEQELFAVENIMTANRASD